MEIPTEKIEYYSDVLHEELLPQLIGKVFHVTTAWGFKKILKSGLIINNKKEDFEFTYLQSGNSYGRKRGYIESDFVLQDSRCWQVIFTFD